MKIEKIQIDKIKPYWRNPRKIDEAVKKVKESIEKYGFNNPIFVDKENVIIAGHTRYKALKELGYKEIDCVISDLSEEKAKQFRIIDNKTAEFAKWDKDLLTFEIREIEELENMKSFFSDNEWKSFDLEIEDFEKDQEEKIITGNVTNKENFSPSPEEIQKNKEEIQKAEHKENTIMNEKSNKIQGDYIELMCPYCEEIYTLSRNEIISKEKIRNNDI